MMFFISVAAVANGEGRHMPLAALPVGGISRKIKKIWPVYSHLNALQLATSVHQKCSKFIFGRGCTPDAYWRAP